jgi:hypothetical protein
VRLTDLTVNLDDLGVISTEQAQPRSVGVHVSAIIDYLSRMMGRRDNDFTRQDLDAFAVVGRMFERILAEVVFRPPRYIRPGEIFHDDIIGSPDALDLDDLAVVEIKATWKSSKHDIKTFREYWWQIMAYCQMTGLTKARLYVFYVCGDWAPPKPIWPPRAWEATFTQSELNENWKMLKGNIP